MEALATERIREQRAAAERWYTSGGAFMVTLRWRHYADPRVAPLR